MTPKQRSGQPPRILVVASPMVSAGGVYSYLERVLPRIRDRGWTTGLLWTARVPVEPPPADWSRAVAEGESMQARRRHLQSELRTAIEEWRPDVLLSVLPQSDVACAHLRRETGLPWVAMVHGNPWPRAGEMPFLRRIAWRAAVALAYRRADGIVAVSGVVADEVKSALRLRRPITNVGSGVDVPEPTARPQRSEPTIGYLGRLSHEKAPDLFIEIARLAGTRALIYGDGPLAETVTSAAAQHPLIEYHGWSDRDAALDEIDVLVVASRREAMPLVVLEAGARGICTIARDTGGIGEVLSLDPELSKRCLLPRTAEPADFAASLRTLLDAPQERDQLALRLHEVVRRHFALDKHVDRLLGAVESILAPPQQH
ncbi:MAG TPA: glycosyltransferase family 4 protein [Thermoleophilaceae bacterium]|nr:glycosyltransferase family 4 protein [Thermoleophilaceae bacterium]